MIYIIVLGIIFLVNDIRNDFGINYAICNGILGMVYGAIVWVAVGGIIGTNLPMVEIVTEQPICALNDSTSIEGRNYVFSGYVEENLVYRYVIETEKGKKNEEIRSNNVYIKEGDYVPTIRNHDEHFAEDWYYWFAFPWKGDHYIEFLVPENTVTDQYNIDLQ